MRLVVDSNILFTFFWKNSVARKLFVDQNVELFSPEYALEELHKYREEIMKKAKITVQEFNDAKKELMLLVEFVPLEEYKSFLAEAGILSPDKNDVDFVALSLKNKCLLWSNDLALKKAKVAVLDTADVICLMAEQKEEAS